MGGIKGVFHFNAEIKYGAIRSIKPKVAEKRLLALPGYKGLFYLLGVLQFQLQRVGVRHRCQIEFINRRRSTEEGGNIKIRNVYQVQACKTKLALSFPIKVGTVLSRPRGKCTNCVGSKHMLTLSSVTAQPRVFRWPPPSSG